MNGFQCTPSDAKEAQWSATTCAAAGGQWCNPTNRPPMATMDAATFSLAWASTAH
jgi:hypothetical protein